MDIEIDNEDNDILWGKGMADSWPQITYYKKQNKLNYPILTILCYQEKMKKDLTGYERYCFKKFQPAISVLNNCGYQLARDEMILYKDGNIFNLKRKNLSVIKKNHPLLVPKFDEVKAIKHIYFNAWGNNYAVYHKDYETFNGVKGYSGICASIAEAKCLVLDLEVGLKSLDELVGNNLIRGGK